jgi:AcrR family transcriptional regulator
MGRPREHGSATYDALLAVAGTILGSDGVDALTVRRVAESAGTTTRAVYTLFGDKNGLLRALFRQMAEVMRRHHEGVPEMDDPFEEIQRLAAAYRAAAREQPNLYDYYYRCMAPDGVITEDDVSLAFRSFDRVLRTLHRIVASGAFGARTEEQTGRQLWALVHGLAAIELRGFLGSSEEACRRAWRSAVAAILIGFQQPEPADPDAMIAA